MTGCGVTTTSLFGGRSSQLPVPPCPPIDVALEFGWIDAGEHKLSSNNKTYMFQAMTVSDKDKYVRYLNAWIGCAEARGVVIEKVNQ